MREPQNPGYVAPTLESDQFIYESIKGPNLEPFCLLCFVYRVLFVMRFQYCAIQNYIDNVISIYIYIPVRVFKSGI